MSPEVRKTIAQPFALDDDALGVLQELFGCKTIAGRADFAVPTGSADDSDWGRSRRYGAGMRALLENSGVSLSAVRTICDRLRSALPGPTLKNDLICGLLAIARNGKLDIVLGRPYGSPLWIAVAHPALSRSPRHRLNGSGVGSTPECALMRCLLELGETASAGETGVWCSISATQEALGAGAISPQSFHKISARQRRRCGVPRWPRVDEEIDWIAVTPLSESPWIQRFYVAAECVVLGSRPAPELSPVDSNGCAAARDLDEAIGRGLLELVERDATAIWWYNALPRPRLDWTSLVGGAESATCHDDAYQTANWCIASGQRFFVLDLTDDIQIPVYCAVSSDADESGVAFGLGCHFDPVAALNHACRELVQQRVRLLSIQARGKVLQNGPPIDPLTQRWLSEVHVDRCRQLQSNVGVVAPTNAGDWMVADESPRAMTQRLVECLSMAEVACYWMQIRHSDHCIPAVRCIAPSLRDLGPHFAPGRLFDVPVALGWLQEPTREADMERMVALTQPVQGT